MATATKSRSSAEETTERIKDLNERIVEAARKSGTTYLDAYEKALESIASYQEKAAAATEVDWISAVVETQAKFTRDLTRLYVDAGRELLKS